MVVNWDAATSATFKRNVNSNAVAAAAPASNAASVAEAVAATAEAHHAAAPEAIEMRVFLPTGIFLTFRSLDSNSLQDFKEEVLKEAQKWPFKNRMLPAW